MTCALCLSVDTARRQEQPSDTWHCKVASYHTQKKNEARPLRSPVCACQTVAEAIGHQFRCRWPQTLPCLAWAPLYICDVETLRTTFYGLIKHSNIDILPAIVALSDLDRNTLFSSKSWPLCLDWNVTLTPLLFSVTFIAAKHLFPHLMVEGRFALLFPEAERETKPSSLFKLVDLISSTCWHSTRLGMGYIS